MTKRPRAARRELARSQDALERARAKLAALEAGGTPSHPAAVESASQVEGRAEQLGCLRCAGALRVVEHRARVDPRAGSVREVQLRCSACGAERLAYFRIAPRLH
jgi:hypothetical protein